MFSRIEPHPSPVPTKGSRTPQPPPFFEVVVVAADGDTSTQGQSLRGRVQSNFRDEVEKALKEADAADQLRAIRDLVERSMPSISARHVKLIIIRINGKTASGPFNWADGFKPTGQ